MTRFRPAFVSGIAAVLLLAAGSARLPAQGFLEYRGDPIPSDVEEMYKRGLEYLAKTQTANGSWGERSGYDGPGISALAVLAFLAHGEDPNTGPYAGAVQKAIGFIVSQQQQNGYIGSSMYHHGFCTLMLAEAYGNVQDPRIGPALKKAVDLILTSQRNNPHGGWRYSPDASDADTTVSGAQVVALLAARNAGLAVPDEALDRALQYYRNCTDGTGAVGYTQAGDGGSLPRSAIGTLVFALSRKKDAAVFKAIFRHLNQMGRSSTDSNFFYYLYYAAQAYFHTDMTAWTEWNRWVVQMLKQTQNPDGSWYGSNGQAFSTSTGLLALALQYRMLPIYER